MHGTGDARIEVANGTQDLDRLRGVVQHVAGEQAGRLEFDRSCMCAADRTVTVPEAPGPGESVESSRRHFDLEVRYRWKR